jgi:uncharacterized caspase-like protein
MFVLALAPLAVAPASAEKRVALAIGNGDNAKVGKLPNPTRDAAAMEALLRTAGFDGVEVKRDLDRRAMCRALRDFSDRVRDVDIAVVFYAGHGIEVNRANYLIPVDAVLKRDIDVEDETVPVERIFQILEPARPARSRRTDKAPTARTPSRSSSISPRRALMCAWPWAGCATRC